VAWLESNRDRLLVGFRFLGERCREYQGLDDNHENRHIAVRVLKEIDGELVAGRFNYAARVPRSPKLAALGFLPEQFNDAQCVASDDPRLKP